MPPERPAPSPSRFCPNPQARSPAPSSPPPPQAAPRRRRSHTSSATGPGHRPSPSRPHLRPAVQLRAGRLRPIHAADLHPHQLRFRPTKPHPHHLSPTVLNHDRLHRRSHARRRLQHHGHLRPAVPTDRNTDHSPATLRHRYSQHRKRRHSQPRPLPSAAACCPLSTATSVRLSPATCSPPALSPSPTPNPVRPPPRKPSLSPTTAPLRSPSRVSPTPEFQSLSNCATLQPANLHRGHHVPASGSTATVRTGILRLSSTATNALDFISLLGLSSPAPLVVSPSQLDFGSVELATAPARPHPQQYQPASDRSRAAHHQRRLHHRRDNLPVATIPLAAGQGCILSIAFAPTATGLRSGTLLLPTNSDTQSTAPR